MNVTVESYFVTETIQEATLEITEERINVNGQKTVLRKSKDGKDIETTIAAAVSIPKAHIYRVKINEKEVRI